MNSNQNSSSGGRNNSGNSGNGGNSGNSGNKRRNNFRRNNNNKRPSPQGGGRNVPPRNPRPNQSAGQGQDGGPLTVPQQSSGNENRGNNGNNQQRNNNRRPNSANRFAQNANPNSKRRNNNNNRYGQAAKRRPSASAPSVSPQRNTADSFLHKYEDLRTKYIEARKKYYDMFGRKDSKEVMRLERAHFDALQRLRQYEESLAPWQREVLQNKTNPYPEVNDYSEAHQDDEEELQMPMAPFPDPHKLHSQEEACQQYGDDMEESEGSMEDYKKYKGL